MRRVWIAAGEREGPCRSSIVIPLYSQAFRARTLYSRLLMTSGMLGSYRRRRALAGRSVVNRRRAAAQRAVAMVVVAAFNMPLDGGAAVQPAGLLELSNDNRYLEADPP